MNLIHGNTNTREFELLKLWVSKLPRCTERSVLYSEAITTTVSGILNVSALANTNYITPCF